MVGSFPGGGGVHNPTNCWWFRNPKADHPLELWMLIKPRKSWDIHYQPQLVNAGFLNHQQYPTFKKAKRENHRLISVPAGRGATENLKQLSFSRKLGVKNFEKVLDELDEKVTLKKLTQWFSFRATFSVGKVIGCPHFSKQKTSHRLFHQMLTPKIVFRSQFFARWLEGPFANLETAWVQCCSIALHRGCLFE